jgi:hypothetical protein
VAEKSPRFPVEKSRHSGYARLPREVLTDTMLGHAAVRVYGFLSLGVGQGSVARVGQRLIASKTGMDRGTVAAGIAELVSRGYITVAAAKRGCRQGYVLNSGVFGQKQGKYTEVVSAPSGGRRFASVNVAEVA